MSVDRLAPEVVLRDGPYHGARFTTDRLENVLLIADVPLAPDLHVLDPMDPPVPMSVYELASEFIGADGDREGTYVYTGRRWPTSASAQACPQPYPGYSGWPQPSGFNGLV